MKKIIQNSVLIILTGCISFASCKKEKKDSFVVPPPSSSVNRPPVVNAGIDQTTNLPANNVKLDGSGSTDPDNNITGYEWTKIAGPSSVIIVNPNAVQTQVTNLVQGLYKFELKVTDAGLLFAKDTIQVIVNAATNTAGSTTSLYNCDVSNRPLINAQLIPVGNFSEARSNVTVVSAGSKILYAGGYSGNTANGWKYYSRVDILDVNTGTWSTANLSQARWGMATAVLGNKIFFAGGVIGMGTYTTRVDIYDVSTHTWSITELSTARTEMVGAAAGNKVLFAGGVEGFFDFSSRVDLYDVSTNTWSTTFLTDQAVGTVATVIGNSIFFAGNASDWWAWDFGTISSTINVYDAQSNTWSASALSEARGYLAGIAVGNKNYWAGGLYKQPYDPFTERVEIRDMNTGASTFDCLFQPNAFFSAVLKNNQIVFFTSGVDAQIYWPSNPPVMNKFDIYDVTTKTWSIGLLPVSIYGSSIISVNNTIYVAGGNVNGINSNKVWKLEF